MSASVHLVYRCSHVVEFQDELVPNWVLSEFLGSGYEGIDPNTWAGINQSYGSVNVNEDCPTCKEITAKKRRRENSKAKDDSAAGSASPAGTTVTSSSQATTSSTGQKAQ